MVNQLSESPVTLCEAFQRTVANCGDSIALENLTGASYTWAQYGAEVARIAGGLQQLGVRQGHAVALLMPNRPEFHFCDTAVMHLGAVPVSIYNTAPPNQIAHVLDDANIHTVICASGSTAAIRQAISMAPRGTVENLLSVDGAEEDVATVADLERGDFDIEAATRAVRPDDLATLIYTSGTTGPSKGVELTHRNILAQFEAIRGVTPLQPQCRVLSYLPAAHIADRFAAHYQSMILGLHSTSVDNLAQLGDALRRVRPHFFMAVPRIWEKLKAGVEQAGLQDAASMRAALGLDQLKWAVSGAAPITVEVLEFFEGIGVQILEVWGMSETTCVATMNPPGATRLGTVGTAVDGVELRLAADGELLCRGPIVMRGYHQNPTKTAEAFDDEGWLLTGDIASIDDDGYVTIVDRKKDLIINSAGKNMSPSNIEAQLKASSPLIGQVVVVGDRRPYNVALINPEPQALAAYLEHHQIEATSPMVREEIDRGIRRANERLARVEQIKRFAVVDGPWEPGGDELTPTHKLKRRSISDKYAALIDELYAARRDAPLADTTAHAL